jgi:RNA recognition motif-containing protein
LKINQHLKKKKRPKKKKRLSQKRLLEKEKNQKKEKYFIQKNHLKEEKESDKKDPSPKEEEKEEVKLFVGNLPYSASESRVNSLFSKYGDVDTVKLVQRVILIMLIIRMEDLLEKVLLNLRKQVMQKRLWR